MHRNIQEVTKVVSLGKNGTKHEGVPIHPNRTNTGRLLTLLYSERPKLYTILAFLSAIGLRHLNYFCKGLSNPLILGTCCQWYRP